MKAIWKGSIGFGLVNIPVKLFSATEKSTLDLDMVDKRDLEKIHYQRVNESTGKEVKWNDIGKAFLMNEKYILLEVKDFEDASPEKSKIIEVNHFVDESDIESVYYENSYFIEPDKSGFKAYALLRQALKETGKVGIAQFVLRTAEMLAVIKPYENLLLLNKIRFKEEIRETNEIKIPSSSVNKDQLKMAVKLIDQYSAKFNISKFKDEYSASLLKIIKAKSKGKKTSKHKIHNIKSDTKDLMNQLKASLKKAS
ncbi:MAG TPA: Ku protein [Ignavibacteria bacterium]|nr:Ku protein [Ignavibacteria bacterium]